VWLYPTIIAYLIADYNLLKRECACKMLSYMCMQPVDIISLSARMGRAYITIRDVTAYLIVPMEKTNETVLEQVSCIE